MEAAVKKPVYSTAFVLTKDIDDSAEVAQAIIDNTRNIVYAHALKVNGETVAKVTEDGMDKLLNERLSLFDIPNTDCTSAFTASVTVEDGYFLSEELCTLEDAASVIKELEVCTVVHSITDTEVAYSTETQKNDKQLRGYSAVLCAGQNGINRVTEDITYINGVETGRVQVGSEVISEPVTEIVEIGTARSLVSESDKKVAQSSGFVFPLPRRGWVVSAYFGDGRNHRAVDLACNAGTPIYAVKAGTVISSGWDGDYGYSIVIDHGNGVQTRYSHESELYVKTGDTVKAGEEIGAVGRTGNASGNHLHFEVIINGDRVDPAPYIGLV